MLARKFTVDFFKEKSLKLCEDLTVEANLSYGRFDDARAMFFQEQKEKAKLFVRLSDQERIITNLKTFYAEVLKEIFDKVESFDEFDMS